MAWIFELVQGRGEERATRRRGDAERGERETERHGERRKARKGDTGGL